MESHGTDKSLLRYYILYTLYLVKLWDIFIAALLTRLPKYDPTKLLVYQIVFCLFVDFASITVSMMHICLLSCQLLFVVYFNTTVGRFSVYRASHISNILVYSVGVMDIPKLQPDPKSTPPPTPPISQHNFSSVMKIIISKLASSLISRPININDSTDS